MRGRRFLAGIITAVVASAALVGLTASPALASYPLQSRGIAGFGPTGVVIGGSSYWQSPTYETPSPSADTYHISVAYLDVPESSCAPGNEYVNMTVNYKDNNTGVWTPIGVIHSVWACSPQSGTYIGLAGLPHDTFFHIFIAQAGLSTNCVGSSNCTAHIAW